MYSKLVRLGKDSELATTQSGKQVLKITAAYDVGWGDNKKTVWLDASMWGDRGSKIAQYLTKGTQVVIHADDVEPDAFQGSKGLMTKLKMNIISIELVSRSSEQQSQPVQQAPASNQPARAAQPSYMAGDIPFDDDIGF